MTGAYGALFWLIIAVILFVIEGVTVQLVCLWFAVGSIAALIAAALGAPTWVQFLVFLLASIASLFLGRPVLMKLLATKKEATNADRVIGSTAVVLEEIDNVRETGRVRAMGLDWTARTQGTERIPFQEQVRVLRIEGVKLIVEPLESGEERG